jgi:hypothetical protein
MYTLFVHIGTHKTGSTAIQKALKDSAKRLARENIVWIPFLPFPDNVKYISDFDDAAVRSCREFLLREVEQSGADQNARLVMSDEDFSGNPLTGYLNSSVTARMLRSITEGIDTRIIVYVRRQDSFLESLYTQRMYRGEDGSFSEFMTRIEGASYDWYRLVDQFAQQFGRDHTIVRPYDRKALPESNSLVHAFADLIGSASLKEAGPQFGVNAGYTQKAAEIAEKCNPHLSQKERRKLRFILQSTQPKRPLEEYTYLDAPTRSRILNDYAESNARLAQDYLGDPTGHLFSDPATDESSKLAPNAQNNSTEGEADPRAVFRRLSLRALPLVFAKKLKAVL